MLWILPLAIVVVAVLILVGMYNGLIAKKNQVDNVFGAIDALLKKRHDLIPNLVAAVQRYMEHEKSTLSEITAMRARAVSGNLPPDERVALEGSISKALGGIMVAVENYPDLKANQNFLQLQAALNEVEEQISAARRAYNAAVTDLNNAVEMFPTNMMAASMGLSRRPVFEAPAEERKTPDVKGLFKS